MERARTEWLASLGFALPSFMREHAVLFVVHRAEIDFRRPARLGDVLDATVETLDRGAARLVLRQLVSRDGETLSEARVTLACVDSEGRKPRRMPAALIAALENTK
jgi:acyl-CoA thioester hydrolase